MKSLQPRPRMAYSESFVSHLSTVVLHAPPSDRVQMPGVCLVPLLPQQLFRHCSLPLKGSHPHPTPLHQAILYSSFNSELTSCALRGHGEGCSSSQPRHVREDGFQPQSAPRPSSLFRGDPKQPVVETTIPCVLFKSASILVLCRQVLGWLIVQQ